MLRERVVEAILPAHDLGRAKRFYAEVLGLTPETETDRAARYRCGGASFTVYQVGGRPSNGMHTQMAWMVPDLDAEMAELRKRGVVFEELDLPWVRTTNGVALVGPTRIAWFTDSEGNFLSLTEQR